MIKEIKTTYISWCIYFYSYEYGTTVSSNIYYLWQNNFGSLATQICHHFWSTNLPQRQYKESPYCTITEQHNTPFNDMSTSTWVYLLLSEKIPSHYHVYYTSCHQLSESPLWMLGRFPSETTNAKKIVLCHRKRAFLHSPGHPFQVVLYYNRVDLASWMKQWPRNVDCLVLALKKTIARLVFKNNCIQWRKVQFLCLFVSRYSLFAPLTSLKYTCQCQ